MGKAKWLHWRLYPNLDFADNAADSDQTQEHYAQKERIGHNNIALAFGLTFNCQLMPIKSAT
jgi:hypothetical protein